MDRCPPPPASADSTPATRPRAATAVLITGVGTAALVLIQRHYEPATGVSHWLFVPAAGLYGLYAISTRTIPVPIVWRFITYVKIVAQWCYVLPAISTMTHTAEVTWIGVWLLLGEILGYPMERQMRRAFVHRLDAGLQLPGDAPSKPQQAHADAHLRRVAAAFADKGSPEASPSSSPSEREPQKPQNVMHPLTLRFLSPELEAEYIVRRFHATYHSGLGYAAVASLLLLSAASTATSAGAALQAALSGAALLLLLLLRVALQTNVANAARAHALYGWAIAAGLGALCAAQLVGARLLPRGGGGGAGVYVGGGGTGAGAGLGGGTGVGAHTRRVASDV